MKKNKIAGLLLLPLLAFGITSCESITNSNSSSNSSTNTDNNASDIENSSASDAEENYVEIVDEFSVETEVENGYTETDTAYTFTVAGEYTLSGKLQNKQIIVETTEDSEIKLILNGVSITNETDGAIWIKEADKVTLNSPEGVYNEIYDTRSEKTEDDDTVASGAIESDCDLSLTGKGSLLVSSTYNNGIHSKKDLKIKNNTLKVTAVNNALKGNDSVTIESGNIILISTKGDGIKTTDSDISSKGNQRGIIEILDGTIDIYASCDGIDASYDAIIGEADTLQLNIYTSSYSSYSEGVIESTDSEFYLRLQQSMYSSNYRYSLYLYDDEGNYKWEDFTYYTSQTVSNRPNGGSYYYLSAELDSSYENFMIYRFESNAENSTDTYLAKTSGQTINSTKNMFVISNISNTQISGDLSTYTDNSNNNFFGGNMGMESGNTSKTEYSSKGIKADNEVIINSGTIIIKAYDDAIHANFDVTLENEEDALGDVTINGGTLSLTSKDDAIHADSNLTINDGYISVLESYEGLEGNIITINGGETYVIASDDGMNASGDSPYIYVTGGYLDVSVGSGDVDAIDSNGGYTQTGGFVIAKNATSDTSGNAASLDVDSKIVVNGGTLICVGSYAETPDSTSTNNYVTFGISSSFGGGMFGRPGSQSQSSSVSFTKGTYEIEGTTITFTLSQSYNGMWISSSEFTLNESYTLTNGTTTKTWTQQSKQQSAS